MNSGSTLPDEKGFELGDGYRQDYPQRYKTHQHLLRDIFFPEWFYAEQLTVEEHYEQAPRRNACDAVSPTHDSIPFLFKNQSFTFRTSKLETRYNTMLHFPMDYEALASAVIVHFTGMAPWHAWIAASRGQDLRHIFKTESWDETEPLFELHQRWRSALADTL